MKVNVLCFPDISVQMFPFSVQSIWFIFVNQARWETELFSNQSLITYLRTGKYNKCFTAIIRLLINFKNLFSINESAILNKIFINNVDNQLSKP